MTTKHSPELPDDASLDEQPVSADAQHSPSAGSHVSNVRRPPIRNNFELEPNPFEQSFSRSSNSVIKSSSDDSTVDVVPPKQDNHSSANSSNSVTESNNNNNPSGSPKPTLPPLAALASPGARTFQWGLGSAAISAQNSLRSGPLSPAMLSGPTNVSGTGAFDHTSFRTGLTPGTGLTPLVGGPSSFPPPSPNTAAFLAMVTGATNANPLASVAATITPNTFSALTGNLAPPSHGDPQGQYDQQTTSVSSAASTAANGLFLLSQAHQELTKREEAQARAGSLNSQQNEQDNVAAIPPSATNKRGSKRKQEDAAPKVAPIKKARGGRKKKEETESDDDDDDEPDSPIYHSSANSKSTKDMTDEEKRRNFLERNRQAALKCRQRKKAWLAQLQAKVEFLSTENERLTTALVSSREEISRLNALVGAHGSGAPSRLQTGHLGTNGTHIGGGGQQPISVAVPVGSGNPPTAGVTAGGGNGRGYGY